MFYKKSLTMLESGTGADTNQTHFLHNYNMEREEVMSQVQYLLKGAIIFIAVMFLVGCSSTQKIRIKTEPYQARVFVDTVDAGVTPCEIEVKKKGPAPVIRLEKDGYTVQKIHLKKRFNVGYPIKSVLFGAGWLTGQTISGNLMNRGGSIKVSGINILCALGMVGGTLIGGAFNGSHYKYSPRKIKLSMDKILNPPKMPALVNDKSEIISLESRQPVQESFVAKQAEKIESTQQTKNNLPDNELSIGSPATITLNTEKEFSGILVNESENKYVLDVNGSRLDFYKNVVKDIHQ